MVSINDWKKDIDDQYDENVEKKKKLKNEIKEIEAKISKKGDKAKIKKYSAEII